MKLAGGEKSVPLQQSNATVGDRFMLLKKAFLLQGERERENDEYYEDKCHQNKLKDMQPYTFPPHPFISSLPFLAHTNLYIHRFSLLVQKW
jgi:hypothetical protein